MKTKVFSLLLAGVMLSFIFSTTSCKKEDESVITEDDLAALMDDSYSDAVMEEAESDADEVMRDLEDSGYKPEKMLATKGDVCKTVTIDHEGETYFPKTITVDFGEGCTTVVNGDSITKTGSYTLVVTGRYFEAGSKRTLTFNNFKINNIKIEGSRVLTSNGINSENNYSWTITETGSKLTFEDNAVVTRDAEHTHTLVTGGTLARLDDYWLISGEAHGTNLAGDTYKRDIIEPIRKNYACRFFVSGIIEVTWNESRVFTLDFGDGTCDRRATVSSEGESKVIDLKFYRN